MNRTAEILAQLEVSVSASPQVLAQQLGVAPRTVASDIDRLNRQLGSAGSVRLVDGRYRLFVVDEDAYRAAADRLHRSEEGFGSRERRCAAILHELLRNDRVRSEDLALMTAVGRSTVMEDLAQLRSELEPVSVSVVGRPHVGIHLRGPELNIRIFALGDSYRDPDPDLDPDVSAAIDDTARAHKIGVDAVQTIRSWVSVALTRFLGGHPLDTLPASFDALRGTEAERFARDLAVALSPLIHEELPDPEACALALPISGMRTPTLLVERALLQGSAEGQRLVDLILDRVRQATDLDIEPGDLKSEFTCHVSFMLNRLRYRIGTPETDDSRILQDRYPFAYQMARIARDVVLEETGLVMDERELALTGTYFQVFLEEFTTKVERQLTVGIATNRGPGAARLLRAQLTRTLPAGTQFRFVATNPTPRDHEGIDILVTTTRSRGVTGPATLVLPEIFDQEELRRRISALKVGLQGGVVASSGHSPSVIASLLDEQRLVRLPAGTTYPQAIDAILERLTSLGLADSTFKDSLAEREAQSTMLIDSRIAFPHAVAPHAKDLTCALAVMPHGNGEPGLRAVFLMAVPDKSTYDDRILIGAYDEVIRLAGQPSILDRLSRVTSYEQLFYVMSTRPTGLTT